MNDNGRKVASLSSALQLPSQVQLIMEDWKLFMKTDKTSLASAIEDDLSAVKEVYEK